MDKQHAHQLLKVMTDPERVYIRNAPINDESVSEEEERAVSASKEWFKHNSGIPMEEVASQLGLTMGQVRGGDQGPSRSQSSSPNKPKPIFAPSPDNSARATPGFGQASRECHFEECRVAARAETPREPPSGQCILAVRRLPTAQGIDFLPISHCR